MTNNMYTITRYIYFKNPLGRLYRLTGANVGYTLCAKAATHTACIGCIPQRWWRLTCRPTQLTRSRGLRPSLAILLMVSAASFFVYILMLYLVIRLMLLQVTLTSPMHFYKPCLPYKLYGVISVILS